MAAPTTPAPDPWLLRGPAANRPAPVGAASQPQPRATLVAFAPAGTSASVFHGWLDAALAPLGVEVVPVELPGRAARIREPPIADMRQLMDALLPALLPTLRARPFALFGHSAGSWVAYQLARELKTRGGPLPLKLYASANRSPTLAGVQHDVDPTAMHALPEARFWEAMERRYGRNPNMEHPAIRRLLLPTLRADFRLIESWRPLEQQAGTRGPGACLTAEEGMRLPCSVAALGATEDVRYTRQQLGAWSACAPAAAFEERWFEGGHSYISSGTPGRRQLAAWLAADLAAVLDSGGACSLPDAAGAPAADTQQEAGRGCETGVVGAAPQSQQQQDRLAEPEVDGQQAEPSPMQPPPYEEVVRCPRPTSKANSAGAAAAPTKPAPRASLLYCCSWG